MANDPLLPVFLESWDRQCRILDNLAALVDESNRSTKPSPEGMALDMQLCHIHEVRHGWLGEFSKAHQATLGDVLHQEGDQWLPIADLDAIRAQLKVSAKAVRDATEAGVERGGRIPPYDHAVFFLQHMLWHEGYHFALILLGLRNAGIEPSDEWEELNVWGIWRDPEI